MALLQNLVPWLRLTLVPGLSLRMQHRLLAAYGSPDAILAAASAEIASIISVAGQEAYERGPASLLLQQTLDWLAVDGHHAIPFHDSRYPELLRETADPPMLLYALGRVELLPTGRRLAIVGSRNASAQGRRDAHAFAAELSQSGVCIVSGLASGIDAAAHVGGLAGNGGSIAVIGTGIDRIYPRTNRALGERMARDGCIITEFPLGMPPLARNFPRRNRLISGMSNGVLVVEAGLHSGTLITARMAIEQNREVFALPGSIHSPLSKGCHSLIKQGALLVESTAEIAQELRWAGEAEEPGAENQSSLLELLGFGPVSVDELALRSGRGAQEIGAELVMLEIAGEVDSVEAGRYQRRACSRAGRDPRYKMEDAS